MNHWGADVEMVNNIVNNNQFFTNLTFRTDQYVNIMRNIYFLLRKRKTTSRWLIHFIATNPNASPDVERWIEMTRFNWNNLCSVPELQLATKIFEGFGERLFKEFIVGPKPVSIIHYTWPTTCINHPLH